MDFEDFTQRGSLILALLSSPRTNYPIPTSQRATAAHASGLQESYRYHKHRPRLSRLVIGRDGFRFQTDLPVQAVIFVRHFIAGCPVNGEETFFLFWI
jgi:hypothetical protein